MTMRRRVKGIRFDPTLLDNIEKDAARRGEDINTWIEEASKARLRPRTDGGRLKPRLPDPDKPFAS